MGANCFYDIDDVVTVVKTLSEQLKHISAEQRRTNELLRDLNKMLTEEYDDDLLPPS